MQTIIIHGPQGCGKTRNAVDLAAHFGCGQIIDCWDGAGALPEGVLALTSAPRIAPPDRALVVRFDLAMDEAGLVSAVA